MFCEHCGKEIDNNSEFCVHCGMPVGGEEKTQTYMDRSKTVTPRTLTERNVAYSNVGNQVKGTGPAGMSLAEGEVIIKQYNCANVKSVEGYLTVTNKRIMFNATGGNNSSRYSQEVSLSSVSGFTCHRGTNFEWKLIVIGAILAILGISVLSQGGGGYGSSIFSFLGFILLAIGGIMIFLGIRPAFQIIIFAKDVRPSPINIGEGPKSLIGNAALFAFTSTPTVDTDLMISELGALVQDLQSMGDLAIEKWQNRISSRELPKI